MSAIKKIRKVLLESKHIDLDPEKIKRRTDKKDGNIFLAGGG
jgi:hypothetical protein